MIIIAEGSTDVFESISRITMIVDSGNSVVEQVEKQLNKQVQLNTELKKLKKDLEAL